MSYSSLWGIKPNYKGEELITYKNSWYFSPMIWNILSDKYLPRDIMGYVQSVIGLHGQEVWKKINTVMNNSSNTPDRICWELGNQQIFFTKDKECIANSIRKFIEQNKEYDKSKEDNLSPLEREHIIERFNEIADDILRLDENEYPYFVFKNTSCDDNVEFWFYNDKSLRNWIEFLAEFVFIENEKIKEFVENTNYKYSNEQALKQMGE